MSITKLRRQALAIWAKKNKDAIPAKGLLLSFHWGSFTDHRPATDKVPERTYRGYVSHHLMPDGTVKRTSSHKKHDPDLEKDLDLSFIDNSIRGQVLGGRL